MCFSGLCEGGRVESGSPLPGGSDREDSPASPFHETPPTEDPRPRSPEYFLSEPVIWECLTRANASRSLFLKYLIEELVPENDRKNTVPSRTKNADLCVSDRKSDVQSVLDIKLHDFCKNIVLDWMPLNASENLNMQTRKSAIRAFVKGCNTNWRKQYCKNDVISGK